MAIKLLLLEDVDDLGRSGDIVSVRPGFARNYLLPRGHGVQATPGALKLQVRLQEERQKKALLEKEESEKVASQLSSITISQIVKVDHEGHMYGSVSANDVIHLLQEQTGIVLEKKSVALKHPIKQIGVYTIQIRLKEGVTSTITLKVLSEGEANAAEFEGSENTDLTSE